MWKTIPERFHWSNARELARVGVVGGLLAGCGSGGSADEGGGSGMDTGDEADGGDDGQMLPGDIVECCWMVTYGAPLPCFAGTCESYAEEACLAPGYGTSCPSTPPCWFPETVREMPLAPISGAAAHSEPSTAASSPSIPAHR